MRSRTVASCGSPCTPRTSCACGTRRRMSRSGCSRPTSPPWRSAWPSWVDDMPDAPLTPGKRRISVDPATLVPPKWAPFVELGLVSCFSFLRGASDAVDLVETAYELGYDVIGIADANSMAGVVRIHTEAKTLQLRPVIGCRVETVEGLAFLAYPRDRAAYGRLCQLISAGRMSTLKGEWQDKGVCDISLAMLAAQAEDVHLILLP